MQLTAPCLSLVSPPGTPADVLVLGLGDPAPFVPHRQCLPGTALAHDVRVVVGEGREAAAYAAALSCPLVPFDPPATLSSRITQSADRGVR